MASKQIIAYGATVERSGDGSVYVSIPEVKGLPVPEVEQEYPEVTNLDSPDGFREYIKGLKDAGQIELLAGYTSDGYALMVADQNAPDAMYYRVTLAKAPDQSVSGDVFTFRAFPTPRLTPGGIGDPLDMTIALRITGDIEWTAGS